MALKRRHSASLRKNSPRLALLKKLRESVARSRADLKRTQDLVDSPGFVPETTLQKSQMLENARTRVGNTEFFLKLARKKALK